MIVIITMIIISIPLSICIYTYTHVYTSLCTQYMCICIYKNSNNNNTITNNSNNRCWDQIARRVSEASGGFGGPASPWALLPLGFGPHFRLPVGICWATFRPMSAQDLQHRPQERPKTANIGPKSEPRPPT